MKSPRPLALVAAALAACLAATSGTTGAAPQAAADPVPTGRYTVLVADGADPAEAVAAVQSLGGRVVRENPAVGALVVDAPVAGFVEQVGAVSGVLAGAARARSIGSTGPHGAQAQERTAVEQAHRAALVRGGASAAPGPSGLDPLDAKLWNLSMIKADTARATQPGDRGVMVGVLDSGIDGSHPDLAPNLDAELSRNFVTDIPSDPNGVTLDGPCEVESCVDPVDRDESGHGTHVAGTIAAAANGMGLSGVAPGVTLVNIRGGQDGGLLFLQPVVDALTYGADIGLDVINMSFYVDPWLYNCPDNAADTPEQRIEQRTTIEAVNRALEYAHDKGVTLVGSLGNNHEDLGRPRPDTSSPNYPSGAAHPRPIDNATCLDLPVEGPHVIGVSAVGPSGTKADYSNYGVEQISVAAPGGWLQDGFGTPSFQSVDNLILSTYPRDVLEAEGDVDAAGEVTPQGAANGVQKACSDDGTECGYYAYLQGTSMASPHVTAVAALIVSQMGVPDPEHPGTLTMDPDEVERVLLDAAADRACPAPVVSYLREGRTPGFDAPCEGDAAFNGHYGRGIVDALAAVTAEEH